MSLPVASGGVGRFLEALPTDRLTVSVCGLVGRAQPYPQINAMSLRLASVSPSM